MTLIKIEGERPSLALFPKGFGGPLRLLLLPPHSFSFRISKKKAELQQPLPPRRAAAGGASSKLRLTY
jgi:hypothetical protein